MRRKHAERDAVEVERVCLTAPSDYDADAAIRRSEVMNIIAVALSTLQPRAERVLRLRFGFEGEAKSCVEIGEQFGVTGVRIQQISNAAIRRLRSLPKNRALFRDMPELLQEI